MSVWLKLRALFRRADFNRDVEDELAFHLAMLAERSSPEAARKRFGNTTRLAEDMHELRGLGWVERVWQDLRFALRQLRLNPGFAAGAALPLALAIACTAAIFTLTDAVFFRPTGVRDPGRVVAVYGFSRAQNRYLSLSFPDFRDIRSLDGMLESSAAYLRSPFGVRIGDSTEMLNTELVSGDYFRATGVTPQMGRPLLASDDVHGADPAALISDALWEKRFARSTSILGTQLTIGKTLFTIVGVMPKNYKGMLLDWYGDCSVFTTLAQFGQLVPSAPTTDFESHREFQMLMMVARLQPHVAVRRLQAALDVLAARNATKPDQRFMALPAAEARFFPGYRGQALRYLKTLIAACIGALAIACFNLANLLFARAASRQREIATRLAIGASRVRLAQQFMVEHLVLAGCACAAAAPLAIALTSLVLRGQTLYGVKMSLDLSPDPRALVVGMLAGLLTAMLASIIPIWRLARADLQHELRGAPRMALRDIFAIAQVACALTVLAASTLLLKSIRTQRTVPLGFDSSQVLVASLDVFNGTSPPPAHVDALRRTLLAELRAQVPAAALSWLVFPTPLRSAIDVVPDSAKAAPQSLSLNWVSDGYFETLRMPLRSGRGIMSKDDRQAAPVAIVNRTAADELWPGVNPLGHHLRLRGELADREVVGVVQDAQYRSLGGAEGVVPFLFLPAAQRASPVNLELQVRTPANPLLFAPTLRRIVKKVAPEATLYDVRTLDDQVESGLALMLMAAEQIGAVCVLGVALALAGIFASCAWRVEQQKKDIAIRMAVGASQETVTRTFVLRGLWMGITGAVAGAAPAWWGARLLRASIPGVGTLNLALFALACAALVCCAALASWAATSRIARLHTADTLRVQ